MYHVGGGGVHSSGRCTKWKRRCTDGLCASGRGCAPAGGDVCQWGGCVLWKGLCASGDRWQWWRCTIIAQSVCLLLPGALCCDPHQMGGGGSTGLGMTKGRFVLSVVALQPVPCRGRRVFNRGEGEGGRGGGGRGGGGRGGGGGASACLCSVDYPRASSCRTLVTEVPMVL